MKRILPIDSYRLIAARRELRHEVVDQPADLPGEDQGRYRIRTVPLQQPSPVGDLQVYQRPLIHVITPCFLSAMARKRW